MTDDKFMVWIESLTDLEPNRGELEALVHRLLLQLSGERHWACEARDALEDVWQTVSDLRP